MNLAYLFWQACRQRFETQQTTKGTLSWRYTLSGSKGPRHSSVTSLRSHGWLFIGVGAGRQIKTGERPL